MCAIVAREPDLVHAIVEADDAVFRHDAADIPERVAAGSPGTDRPSARSLIWRVFPCRRARISGIRIKRSIQPLGQRGDGRPDVADHFGIGIKHLFHGRRDVADIEHLGAADLAHQEGRLFDRVVADGDDQVRALDRVVNIVALRERRRPR